MFAQAPPYIWRRTACFSPRWSAARRLPNCAHCLAEAQAEIEGGASPRVAPFADLRDLGGLLQRAGLALPVTDCDSFIVRYLTPWA